MWTYPPQRLSQVHSFRQAVAGRVARRLALGQRLCSPETGAYCTAREKIPEVVCRQLLRGTGVPTADEAPSEWRWLGRRVLAVEGATVNRP